VSLKLYIPRKVADLLALRKEVVEKRRQILQYFRPQQLDVRFVFELLINNMFEPDDPDGISIR